MRLGREGANQCGAIVARRVNDNRALVAVQMEKQPRALRMGDVVWERPEVSARITARRFEFHHIRPLVCQELRGIGTRHAAGEINDAHPCKRATHMTSFLSDVWTDTPTIVGLSTRDKAFSPWGRAPGK
jgi:hypothetical protein